MYALIHTALTMALLFCLISAIENPAALAWNGPFLGVTLIATIWYWKTETER